MQTLTPVEFAAAPARLEQHIARMVDDEPTLADISAVLHLVGIADDIDGVRIQSLCYLAARALGKFDSDARTAPPAGLAEILRDARQDCPNEINGCDEHVLPWVFDGTYCSPTCRSEYLRATGS